VRPSVVLVVLLGAGAVAAAAFVLSRVRQRIHALRLEVTRVAALCGALQTRIDEMSGRVTALEEALFFELYPAEVLPLIDKLDRGGRLTDGTAARLRRLTMDIRADAWSDYGTGVADPTAPQPT
jgi:hypothetical protein